ncbi:NmrA family NAD(P)-binding protein [Cellulosimicrobium sp. CUA-896]|uniref:NmrA family NAD(P)-binding protein n=1 Tax=Cellulosimicrobium sp. CUA-896 TaxID=1517881 RepID=UPI00095D8B5D|nr:NmrA family NAD(P)-binding protein [Cellulosimicrobium sp. CUA-896]OLT55135.1 nucleoside-diphosphate sugar epimerase [Cellulosimicrobium sp. CUA-896]
MRILITSVRGKTGSALADRLAPRDDVELLGGSTDPARVTRDGVVPVELSWDRPDGWAPATTDVDAVFVVVPLRADAPELVAEFLATASPSTHVVLLSERDPEQSGPQGWSARVEQAVRASGRSWTLLRPGWFMQVMTDPRFLRDQIAEGELAFPHAQAPVAWTDVRDIAEVAELALLDREHAGRTYELSGPQAVLHSRTAELLSAALGRPVVYTELGADEALDGLTGFERDLTALTYERVRAGHFAVVTDDVPRLTGRPARSVEAFVADAAAAGVWSRP